MLMMKDFQYGIRKRVRLTVALALITAGCAERPQEVLQICPGKGSAVEALSALQTQAHNAAPLRANGTCRLKYYADGKPKKEQFPIKLWLNPAAQIYLQGDVAFDPRAVVLGSNVEEFWLAIRLKEVSSYWWGRWSQASRAGALLISPRLVLEGLGIMVSGSEADAHWSLSKQGVFDVLTQRGRGQKIIRKIYIYCCDYSVRKIEYFDVNGRPVLTLELEDYEQVNEDFAVPGVVKITSVGEQVDEPTQVTVKLTSVKPITFSEKLKERIFVRPEPEGFKHVYRIVGGDVLELR
jgi:hypothetical protein